MSFLQAIIHSLLRPFRAAGEAAAAPETGTLGFQCDEPTVAVEPPPTWEAVVAALEFEVAEIRNEEASLNFSQPELLNSRVSELERAREARSQGVPVTDWCVYETLRERDATRVRLEMESNERAAEAELSE